MIEILSEELVTFNNNLPGLLVSDLGRYALVKGQEVASTWESPHDAIADGYKRFGNVPFLVKAIVEVEVPIVFHGPILN